MARVLYYKDEPTATATALVKQCKECICGMEVQVSAKRHKGDSGLCIQSWHYWSWYYWSCGAPQNALITGVPVVTSHAAKKARASIATRPLSISAS